MALPEMVRVLGSALDLVANVAVLLAAVIAIGASRGRRRRTPDRRE